MRRNKAAVTQLLISFLLLIPLFRPEIGRACAPAPRPGQVVSIAEESAVILWDEANRTEHFIRRAMFDSDAPDFGFLVPTPAAPELAEASDTIFTTLENRIEPPVVFKNDRAGVDFTPFLLGFFLLSRPAMEVSQAPGGVRVISAKRIAGFDAVVLEANDAKQLKRWLGKHGYEASPAIIDWLAPYIAAGWMITAFKIAKDAPNHAVETSAVRMSFRTDRPFFPYREPAPRRKDEKAQTGSRLLRVFFLGANRMEGSMGKDLNGDWPARVVWADRLNRKSLEFLSAALPGGGLPPPESWLTVFEDKSSPRPGTEDVYFSTAPTQIPVEPPPIIHNLARPYYAPIDLILLFIGGIFLFCRWKRRKARATRITEFQEAPNA